MLGDADLTTWRHDDGFAADPTALTVIDRELVIRAVNPALERSTGYPAAELVGRYLFDAFPANPGEPDGDDGRVNMTASVRLVLEERRQHHLVVQRYDIPDPADRDRFVPKNWVPVNAPVWSDDEVVGGADPGRRDRPSTRGRSGPRTTTRHAPGRPGHR